MDQHQKAEASLVALQVHLEDAFVMFRDLALQVESLPQAQRHAVSQLLGPHVRGLHECLGIVVRVLEPPATEEPQA